MSNTPDNNRLDQPSSRHRRLEVEIIVDPTLDPPIEQRRLHDAVIAAASYRGFRNGKIGIRVTDDATIAALNRKHLGHDYPTDVISFAYENDGKSLEGELVVSMETAEQRSAELGWSAASELLLYVVHGTLHITGMDDQDPGQRRQMRKAEQEVLIRLGIREAASFAVEAPVAPASRQTEESR